MMTAAPPPRVKYQAEAEWLRDHPGQWIVLRETTTDDAAWSAAEQIRNGRRAAFRPAGTFAASAEGLQVKVCYVGG